MARIEWIEQRLLNWARWRLGRSSGALGYAAVALGAANGGRGGYVEAPIPTNECEAAETDDAVARLPSALKATVIEQYTGEGGERDHVARLCCGRATLYARIDQAQRLLADHFEARRQERLRERRRVETLVRSRGDRRGGFTPET